MNCAPRRRPTPCGCAARPTPTADRIRADAARQDPQFYTFLKKLEDYQRILGDNKSMLAAVHAPRDVRRTVQPAQSEHSPPMRSLSPIIPTAKGDGK